MTLEEAEQRIIALEKQAVPFMAKHWQIVVAIAFVIGAVGGHFIK